MSNKQKKDLFEIDLLLKNDHSTRKDFYRLALERIGESLENSSEPWKGFRRSSLENTFKEIQDFPKFLPSKKKKLKGDIISLFNNFIS
jgi:hypothetical protein